MQEKNSGQLDRRPGKYSYRRKGPVVLACLALVITLLGGLATAPRQEETPPPETGYAVREASYPEMAQRPAAEELADAQEYEAAYAAWLESRAAQLDPARDCAENLEPFLQETAGAFLTETGGGNRVFSPAGLYVALSALAEATGGETRQQLFDLLGVQDVEALRGQAGVVWNACYCADGETSSLLGNSLWLDEGISFVPSTMDTLAGTYRTSSYQGTMGSETFNGALRDWINGQTANRLQNRAAEEAFSTDTVAALVSTVLYQASWTDAFQAGATKQGAFHTPDGELECAFLFQSRMRDVCRGDGFLAVSLSLDEGRARMWLLLPDEGTAPEELLSQRVVMDFLLSKDRFTQTALVHLALPKFDVSSQLDLGEGLGSLGVVNMFAPDLSNFAPLTDRADLFISSAEQLSRVSVDENGFGGAERTAGTVDAGAIPDDAEEIEFTLDRPFLFAVTTADQLPILLGVVNDPS